MAQAAASLGISRQALYRRMNGSASSSETSQGLTAVGLLSFAAGAILAGLSAWLIATRRIARLGERAAQLQKTLETERGARAERELLLQTIVGTAPMAVVLYGELGTIVYSNAEARELFFEGKELEGRRLLDAAEGCDS